jgi:ABC-type dipeptide/oligopeptide/nickel transport system permease component
VLTFLLRRLLLAVPVLGGVSVAVFLMLHLVPGDPAALFAGMEASRADVEAVRRSLGLDEPLPVQYARFLGRLATGDLGRSFKTGRPVAEEIGARYGNTLLLGLAAMTVAVAAGTLAGIVSAVRARTPWDAAALLGSLLGLSMPPFFLGLVLMLVFSVWLGWLPLAGKEGWRHFVLPAATLGIPAAAVLARMVRSSLLEVLAQDYVRTARAKGLSELVVVNVHAVRNALVPVVTVVGLQLGYLLGGAVVTETLFAWPGIGRLIVQAITARDFPVVQASVLLLATTFVVINLVTDLCYSVLDPRITAQ